MVVARGWGTEEMESFCVMDIEFQLERWKSSRAVWWWQLHNNVSVLDATELYLKILKMVNLFNHNKKIVYSRNTYCLSMAQSTVLGHIGRQTGSSLSPSRGLLSYTFPKMASFQSICPLNILCTFALEYKFLKDRGLPCIHLISLELSIMLRT